MVSREEKLPESLQPPEWSGAPIKEAERSGEGAATAAAGEPRHPARPLLVNLEGIHWRRKRPGPNPQYIRICSLTNMMKIPNIIELGSTLRSSEKNRNIGHHGLRRNQNRSKNVIRWQSDLTNIDIDGMETPLRDQVMASCVSIRYIS